LIDDDGHTLVGWCRRRGPQTTCGHRQDGFDGLKVSSVVVVADETLSGAGYQLGASVGLNSITSTPAAMSSPYGGSVTSRSLTNRASMEGISATSTSVYLVDNARGTGQDSHQGQQDSG